MSSFHTDYDRWLLHGKKENCPVCKNLPMPAGMLDLYELDYSWLNAEPVDCLRGACHVTSKRHVVELYELDDDELLGFMKDVNIYAEALKNVTTAVKINYEIHGNTVPHLHLHLYPRYLDDPFPGQPIDYRQKTSSIYVPGEFDSFLNDMRAEITRLLER